MSRHRNVVEPKSARYSICRIRRSDSDQIWKLKMIKSYESHEWNGVENQRDHSKNHRSWIALICSFKYWKWIGTKTYMQGIDTLPNCDKWRMERTKERRDRRTISEKTMPSEANDKNAVAVNESIISIYLPWEKETDAKIARVRASASLTISLTYILSLLLFTAVVVVVVVAVLSHFTIIANNLLPANHI